MRASILPAFVVMAALAGGCTSLPRADTMRAQSPPAGTESPPVEDTKESDAKRGDSNNGSEKKKADEGPKAIRDNGFLIEEAFNQEPGQVQHIFNWINFWDHSPVGRTRDFLGLYTMELPLGSQTHQFSFTTNFVSAFEEPTGGPARQRGGVSDTFLNYRYQLLADDDFLWVAPRFTLIVPTGDRRFDTGTGELGYQFNLPVSRYGDEFDYHFNIGATIIPNVSAPLDNGLSSPAQDLRAYLIGAAAYWKPRTDLNFFVEVLAQRFERIDDRGVREHADQVFVNPGVRYAIYQSDEVEWVVGVSAPIGLTKDTSDIGLFLYMSVEHMFRKVNENGAKD